MRRVLRLELLLGQPSDLGTSAFTRAAPPCVTLVLQRRPAMGRKSLELLEQPPPCQWFLRALSVACARVDVGWRTAMFASAFPLFTSTFVAAPRIRARAGHDNIARPWPTSVGEALGGSRSFAKDGARTLLRPPSPYRSVGGARAASVFVGSAARGARALVVRDIRVVPRRRPMSPLGVVVGAATGFHARVQRDVRAMLQPPL